MASQALFEYLRHLLLTHRHLVLEGGLEDNGPSALGKSTPMVSTTLGFIEKRVQGKRRAFLTNILPEAWSHSSCS